MRDPHLIIERPLYTEKSTSDGENNKFHFRVALDANKIEIASAIEFIYQQEGVKVLAVNTLHVKGKKRRVTGKRGKPGYATDWKKAIVTTDRQITLFEGV